MLARAVYDWISQGEEVARACERAVASVPKEIPVGVIAISRRGLGHGRQPRHGRGVRNGLNEDSMLATGSRIIESLPREFHGMIRKFQKIQEIGSALSAEKDLGALLTLILRESATLTGSDSGTIYVREDEVEYLENATAKDTLSRSTPYLVAKFTRNDSLDLPFKEFRLPFDVKTVAGYVANSGRSSTFRTRTSCRRACPSPTTRRSTRSPATGASRCSSCP